jgi:hypothetical protein
MRQRCLPVDAAAGVRLAAGEMLPGAPAGRVASAIRALLRFPCRGEQDAAAHRHHLVRGFSVAPAAGAPTAYDLRMVLEPAVSPECVGGLDRLRFAVMERPLGPGRFHTDQLSSTGAHAGRPSLARPGRPPRRGLAPDRWRHRFSPDRCRRCYCRARLGSLDRHQARGGVA